MTVVDQHRDPAFASLIPLLDRFPREVEEAIKHANVQIEERDALPDTAYAWQEKRAFAIHTRENAIMSRVYRSALPAVPVEVDLALKEACEAYGIPEEWFQRQKVAAADDSDDYLLPEKKALRVKCAEDVRVAEQKLIDGFTRLSIPSRAQACGRLVEKAAKFNVKLGPQTLKLAGFTVSSTDTMRRWLDARVEAAKDPIVKQAFQQMADGLRAQPPEIRDRGALVKMASAIHELDKRGGLEQHYDKRLPDPLQTVFNTEKVAEPGVNLGGRYVTASQLAMRPSSFYGDVLGDDLVREASDGHGGVDPYRLATILETLPMDMKSALGRQFH